MIFNSRFGSMFLYMNRNMFSQQKRGRPKTEFQFFPKFFNYMFCVFALVLASACVTGTNPNDQLAARLAAIDRLTAILAAQQAAAVPVRKNEIIEGLSGAYTLTMTLDGWEKIEVTPGNDLDLELSSVRSPLQVLVFFSKDLDWSLEDHAVWRIEQFEEEGTVVASEERRFLPDGETVYSDMSFMTVNEDTGFEETTYSRTIVKDNMAVEIIGIGAVNSWQRRLYKEMLATLKLKEPNS